jgi:tetratricopeptide (TPR) repeat protein
MFHFCDSISFLLQFLISGNIFRTNQLIRENVMSITAILSTVLVVTQPITSTPGPEPVIYEQRDVAFDELSSGRTAEAVASLETSLQQDARDPATLINLGTAYAQLGDAERAERALTAAVSSPTRYQVEMADGSWQDSRAVARRGLERLEKGYALAALGN